MSKGRSTAFEPSETNEGRAKAIRLSLQVVERRQRSSAPNICTVDLHANPARTKNSASDRQGAAAAQNCHVRVNISIKRFLTAAKPDSDPSRTSDRARGVRKFIEHRNFFVHFEDLAALLGVMGENRATYRAAQDNPTLLTIEEVAVMLNVGPRFVRRLVAERRIAFHKVGHYVRFDAVDVAAWIAAGRVDTTGGERRRR